MAKATLAGAGLAVAIFLIYLGIDPLPLLMLVGLIMVAFYLPKFQTEKSKSWIGKKRTISSPVAAVSFDDIGGQVRAKLELKEALDFLNGHEDLKQLGIRPLKGILLVGPPGTGKTLMAKAAAHYTESVFVSASGSEFVEMYAGVGAQRVRELFQKAVTMAKKEKKDSAILFIDEIDAIGGRREQSHHREYDQTLNQLLTEMDGIASQDEVRLLVIAATNRKELLDPALLRPGRFDRHILVDLPDKAARLDILKLHTRNKPLHQDLSLSKVAEESFGFSGAQLESVANEAAIYALREKKRLIEARHFSLAIDKVMMGEMTDREATREEKERVAVHELGHALIAELVHPGSVSQVALTPRGQALGYVRQHPGEDRYLYTREQLENQIKVCLAGAAAEEFRLGNRSTGAKNDYEKANRYARSLVECGLSDLGIIEPELIPHEALHAEITSILHRLFAETQELIQQHAAIFERGFQILLQEEVLLGDDFRKMLKKNTPEPAKIDKVNAEKGVRQIG